MRELRKKSKLSETVELPTDLVNFLSEVHQKILAKDEETVIPSDDLIQNDFAYGGLIDETGTIYEFTYFPKEGTRVKWQLMLSKDRIERIADGKIDKLGFFSCQDANCGCKFYDIAADCFYCDWIDVA